MNKEYPFSINHEPGTWKGLQTPEGRKASFTCPICGQVGSLASHDIDHEGNVSPSVVCSYGCGFHEYIKLIGWSSE